MKFRNTLFCLLLILSSTVLGRSPAVEPVTGISIDQYQEVSPEKDPGFNWNQGPDNVASTSLITTRVPAQNTLITDTTSQGKSLATTLLLIGLLTLPFFLWNGIMKGLDKTSSQSASTAQTVDLNSEREKRNNTEELDEKKKAS